MATPRFPSPDSLRLVGERTLYAVSSWAASGCEKATEQAARWRQSVRAGESWSSLLLSAAQPWRLAVGAVAVLLPALVLSLLNPALPVTAPGAILMVAVALSAYLTDLAGGISSLILTAFILDLRFVGDRSVLSWPRNVTEALGFIVTMLSGVLLVCLVVGIKREGAEARISAAAARAAANALTMLESTAASQVAGDRIDMERLLNSILFAMIRVHRAHGGSLLLVDPTSGNLYEATTYGRGSELELPTSVAISDGFVGQIAQERRPLAVHDIQTDARFALDPLRRAGVRAALGVPLIGATGVLLGVVHVDLLVPYRFSATDIAKLEALASKASSLLESARAADERELLLRGAQEQQRRLHLVIATIPEAVVIVGCADERIIAFNEAAERLFGPLGDQMRASDVASSLLKTDGEPLQPDELPLLTALESGEVTTGLELTVRRGGQAAEPVLASAAPLRELDGSISAAVGVFRDITALKAADRLQAEFVSVVSHELLSPLTPIRGFVQLVARELEREGGHATQAARLRSIEGHVDRMTRLVDDLLDVSRLRAGRLEMKPVRCDLVALCREVIQTWSAASPEHRVTLRTPASSLSGDWDPDRLHQIIDNLVGNAVKYSPAGGEVTLSLVDDPTHQSVRFEVADSGPGIPNDDLERVFSAFYRTRDASESRIMGLGLGLFICRELVTAHGGTIDVRNAPQGGAVFSVGLPRQAAIHAVAISA